MSSTFDNQRLSSLLLPDNIILEVIKGLEKGNKFDIHGGQIAVIRDFGTGQESEPQAMGFPRGTIDGVTPVEGETTFPFGNISQLFTIVALDIALRSRGFDLTTHLKKILPDLKLSEEGLSEKLNCIDIITHMTGLPSLEELEDKQVDKHNIIEKLSSIPLSHEYNSKYHYSTLPWLLIEIIIERMSEKDFATFIKDEIIIPRRLKFTTIGEGNERAIRGIKSNARDLLKFFPYLLKQPIYQQLLETHCEREYQMEPTEKSWSCMGFTKTQHNDVATYENYSSNDDYASLSVILKDYKTTFVVLCKKVDNIKEEREDYIKWIRSRLIEYHSTLDLDEIQE